MFSQSSVFALINIDGNVEVRLVEMESETQNNICLALSDTVKVMEEKQPVEFDGKYKPNGDELLMIKEFVISDEIADAIRNPLSVVTLSYSKTDEPDIRAIFVGNRQELNGSEVFAIAFQRFRKEQYLSTRVCLETISAKSKLKQYKWFVEKHALVYHIASQSADNSSID